MKFPSTKKKKKKKPHKGPSQLVEKMQKYLFYLKLIETQASSSTDTKADL